MEDQEFEDMRVEMLNILADTEVGKLNDDMYNSIVNRIASLNKLIDKMPPAKSIEDYMIIDACYQYYRVKDFFFRYYTSKS